MAPNEYRQLNCRILGNNCDFLIRAGTDENLSKLVQDHLCVIPQTGFFIVNGLNTWTFKGCHGERSEAIF
jgi:hypothetical protein